MTVVATLPARTPIVMVGVKRWSDVSRDATLVIGRFRLRLRLVEVALVQVDNLYSTSVHVFTFGYDACWAAIVRNPKTHDVYGCYEFYTGQADLFDPTIPGRRLIGKAIEVDAGHQGLGIAKRLLRTLRRAGVLIAPDGLYTPIGASLANRMAKEFPPVAVNTITYPWPPEGLPPRGSSNRAARVGAGLVAAAGLAFAAVALVKRRRGR